jgi:hypothetical protein
LYLNYDAYRLPILVALQDLGGRDTADNVLRGVFDLIGDRLTYDDVNKVTSGEVAWRNRARWTKDHMVKEGLLSPKDRRGQWEISDRGKKELTRWTGIKA